MTNTLRPMGYRLIAATCRNNSDLPGVPTSKIDRVLESSTGLKACKQAIFNLMDHPNSSSASGDKPASLVDVEMLGNVS